MNRHTPLVAVASRSFSRHPVLRQALLERFPRATFNDAGKSLAGAELIDFLRGHDSAVTALETLDDGLFAAVPELRVVSKYGVGLDMIDLAAMDARGIRLGWTGGVNRRSVAELVISSAIALLHRVPEATAEVRAGLWRQIAGRQLTGKTVGVIGCGHVGKDVMRLARGFGCRLLAHDIVDFPEFYRDHGVNAVSLDELLETSDVVSIHVPLDGTTHDLISADQLAKMKPGAVLLNLARGGIVNEAALLARLRSGALAGAALDVFEHEPPTDRSLIELSNVIITPHIGGSTEEAVLAMGLAAISGLETAKLPSELGLIERTRT